MISISNKTKQNLFRFKTIYFFSFEFFARRSARRSGRQQSGPPVRQQVKTFANQVFSCWLVVILLLSVVILGTHLL